MKLSLMSASLTTRGIQPALAAEKAAALGLDGIEWVTDCKCTAAELRKFTDDAGLPVVCHTFFAQKLGMGLPGGLDAVRRGIDYAHVLGAPVVMIPFAPLPELIRKEAKECWKRNFVPAVELLEESGLCYAVENYPGAASPMIYASDFREYQRIFPGMKLVFDDGNAASVEDEVESCRTCFGDIVHVHFKDWRFFRRPVGNFMPTGDGRFMASRLIGEGDVRTAEVWNLLKSGGYSGYVSLEYEGHQYDPVGALAQATHFLKNIKENS